MIPRRRLEKVKFPVVQCGQRSVLYTVFDHPLIFYRVIDVNHRSFVWVRKTHMIGYNHRWVVIVKHLVILISIKLLSRLNEYPMVFILCSGI